MQLFNQGNRKIICSIGEIEPKQLFEVKDKEAKILLGLYANEIVEPSAVPVKGDNKEVEGLKAEIDVLKADIDALKADLEAITAERDALKAEVEAAKKAEEANK